MRDSCRGLVLPAGGMVVRSFNVLGPGQAANFALPAFAAQFSEQAIIYIDDAKRPTETEMVRQWLQHYPGWKSWTFETIPGRCILERRN